MIVFGSYLLMALADYWFNALLTLPNQWASHVHLCCFITSFHTYSISENCFMSKACLCPPVSQLKCSLWHVSLEMLLSSFPKAIRMEGHLKQIESGCGSWLNGITPAKKKRKLKEKKDVMRDFPLHWFLSIKMVYYQFAKISDKGWFVALGWSNNPIS